MKLQIYDGCRFGSDPEFFLVNKKTGLLAPLFEAERDGLAWEPKIIPSSCRDIFGHSVVDTIRQVYLSDNLEFTGNTVEKIAKGVYPKKFLRIGCRTSNNLYIGEENPAESESLRWRASGGHIHIGHPPAFLNHPSGILTINLRNNELVYTMVNLFDRIGGLLSTAMCHNPEQERLRKKFYGKAGSYRPKTYGIEYRTPTSWDIFFPHNRYILLQGLRLAWFLAVSSFSKTEHIRNKAKSMVTEIRSLASDEEIVDIINNVKKDDALRLIEPTYRIIRPKISDYRSGLIYTNKLIKAVKIISEFSEKPVSELDIIKREAKSERLITLHSRGIQSYTTNELKDQIGLWYE
jgi:hypothetical protein